jgi:Ca-activated chloride channel family protein
MKIDANDPRWTAYALGEIKDGREKAEIESVLKESKEMRQLVEEIRQMAGVLKTELQAEPSVHLTQAQRERIEAKATAGRSWIGVSPRWIMYGAAAAVMLISFITFRQLRQVRSTHQPTQMAAAIPQKSVPATRQRIEELAQLNARHLSGTEVNAQLDKKAEAAAPAEPERAKIAALPPITNEHKAAKEAFRDTSDAVPSETPVESGAAGKELALKSASVAPAPSVPPPQPNNAVDTARLTGGAPGGVAHDAGEALAALPAGTLGTTPAEMTARLAVPAPPPIAAEEGSNRVFTNQIASFASVASGLSQIKREGTTGDEAGYPRVPRRRNMPPIKRQHGQFNTESYDYIADNPFLDVAGNPLSTFSIDVDTASYSNVRRFLEGGTLPPKDAVRIEELVNYFDYDYKGPKDGKPFAANFEIAQAPWNPEHQLLRIGLKALEISPWKRPNSNLVFLLDVSGSMADGNKLPLVKESMRLLLDQLTESDRVAIVVYASNTRLVLPSTSGDQREKIRSAIDRLHAGGSTNGASGIQLAYETAQQNFIQGGVNRVILATDGDFNVGMTNRGDLTRLIEEKAESGIYLSALGFGMGNYKDSTLELLANKGRGNYAYIDTINEAKKVLVEQISSTLIPIARDVKIQVEFNPRHVSAYRLIGYEDRVMPKEDFNDDTKMAGVIGAGHAVTALYELVPAGKSDGKPGVDPLKYQKPPQPSSSANTNELLTLKIRSKNPEKDKSVLSEFTVKDSAEKFSEASQDFKFAAAVAAFGMALRDSPYKGSANLESALEWAKEGKGTDPHGYRQEFIRLIHRAISISF